MMCGEIFYQNINNTYGLIRIERPEKRNAISKRMVEQFKRALKQAKHEQMNCLVITGAGERMFCAGGDLTYLHGNLTEEEAFQELYQMKEVLMDIVSFPVPVICLLNGDALGGGCEIATACDIRIAKEGTSFGFIQSTIGITPAWGGGILLYEKVHPSFAFQWILEGKIYEGQYLQKQGWIHRLISEDAWGNLESMIEPYISKSISLMQTLKEQYKRKIASLALSAEMNEEIRNCAKEWHSPTHVEAVNTFLERKKTEHI